MCLMKSNGMGSELCELFDHHVDLAQKFWFIAGRDDPKWLALIQKLSCWMRRASDSNI